MSFTQSTYQLNLLLLRCAAEDAAQQAIAVEIERQLRGQGIPATVENLCFDIDITRADIVVDGQPVGWTEEAL